MNEPLPRWVGVVIAVASLAAMIAICISAQRYELRRRARLRAKALETLASAFGSPLDDRQAELLRHGILPWYEFPGKLPQDPPPESNQPEGGV